MRLLKALPALLILLALILAALRPESHNPIGTLALFAIALLLSLGFLRFGAQREAAAPPPATRQQP